MHSGLRPEQVSQAYLALLERGRRPAANRIGSRIVKQYVLGPTALPLEAGTVGSWDSHHLAESVASLGYPGFRQLQGANVENPALVLLAAISACDVEVRVIEALPWIVVAHQDLDWEWLVREAKFRDVQNRLGFLVTLARQVAERPCDSPAAAKLREIEEVLDRARLVREDTLCQASLSNAERRWLRLARPLEAAHWNLLTDLNARCLPYAA